MHGDPTVHLCTPNSSFIQLKLLSHHWEHNIQRFLGSPQNIQKRSLKLRNTHFLKKKCVLFIPWSYERWGGKGEIMRFCHPWSTDGQMEHSRCKGLREKEAGRPACSWNAVYVNPLDCSYGCASVNDESLTCYTRVEGWVRKHLSGPSEGYESKQKNEGAAKLRKRRRGRGAENAELKERKDC